MAPTDLARVASVFRILSEPSRLAILNVLREHPAPVGEIVDRTRMKQANVSKQLGILFDARLVDRRREGASVIYRIAAPVIFRICELVCSGEMPAAGRRPAVIRGSSARGGSSETGR